MGVFTTQTLLNSVGVSRNTAAPGAVAINWILKVAILLVTVDLTFVDHKFCLYSYWTLKENCNPLVFICFGCKRVILRICLSFCSLNCMTCKLGYD